MVVLHSFHRQANSTPDKSRIFASREVQWKEKRVLLNQKSKDNQIQIRLLPVRGRTASQVGTSAGRLVQVEAAQVS